MQAPKTTSSIMRILLGLLVFWLVSLVFSVLAFIGFALLIGHTYGDLSSRTDLMFWGLSIVLFIGYAASLIFGLRFIAKR